MPFHVAQPFDFDGNAAPDGANNLARRFQRSTIPRPTALTATRCVQLANH
jgi:hypothetical protein